MGMFDTIPAVISRYRIAAYPLDLLIEIVGNVSQTLEFARRSS